MDVRTEWRCSNLIQITYWRGGRGVGSEGTFRVFCLFNLSFLNPVFRSSLSVSFLVSVSPTPALSISVSPDFCRRGWKTAPSLSLAQPVVRSLMKNLSWLGAKCLTLSLSSVWWSPHTRVVVLFSTHSGKLRKLYHVGGSN